MPSRKSEAAPSKVLVVEDEVLLLTSLSGALQDAGFATVEATNADDAIQILGGAEPIRLVVTDLRMPGKLDGVDLVKWLVKTRPSLPVVVTTGYHLDRAALGSVPVFQKPYRMAALIQHVSERLGV